MVIFAAATFKLYYTIVLFKIVKSIYFSTKNNLLKCSRVIYLYVAIIFIYVQILVVVKILSCFTVVCTHLCRVGIVKSFLLGSVRICLAYRTYPMFWFSALHVEDSQQ